MWEYEVPPEARQEFLAHYAADGTWARLFRRAEGYLSTQLYHDRARPERFVTVDQWQDENAFHRFRRDFAAEFEALDRACARLTHRETHLGELDPVPAGGQSSS
jgi:heme-degrading monooxygenase HmoA